MSDESTEQTQSTGASDWRAELPSAFQDAPFIKAAESPEDAVAQLSNAASHMGNSVRLPSENASEQERQAFIEKMLEKSPELMLKPSDENLDQFYASLGRPEKADEYKFEPGEGKEIPSDLAKFREAAHKAGLSQQQFESVLGEVLGDVYQQQEVVEAEQAAEMKELQKEWGNAFDERMETVSNFLKLSDAPDGIRDLYENGAMSPAEIRWIHDVATKTASKQELASQGTEGTERTMTPAEAQAQIQEIMANNAHPYWNAQDPRHTSARQKMMELQIAAHPGSSTTIDALRA